MCSGCEGLFRFVGLCRRRLASQSQGLKQDAVFNVPPASPERGADQTRGGMYRDVDTCARCRLTDCSHVQDVLYLTPILEQIEKESKERDDLEAMTVYKRKGKA